MKFLSIKNLAESVKNTLQRFPFEIAFALAGTIAATIYLHKEQYFNSFDGPYFRIMMTANLGLLLNLAATLFIESREIKGLSKIIFKIIVAVAATCLFFVINPQLRSYDYLRFFMLSLGFHLLVAFAAFISKGHIQGFWQFNKTLFIRFLTSVLYSGVLYLGLIVAISGTKFLFGITLWNNIYGMLWFWIVGIFNTIFFLAGVPANTRSLDEDISYPKGLKIFTQYVLIPLATVYVLILLAYEIKILVQWSLPKGMVSYLILGYSVFGVLSVLLIYPIREQTGNKWIKTYARSFYFLLIPLLILLFLAVGSRIMPYGITVPRYYLIVLALWLVFITIYFLVSKKQNIKLIPVSMCILTLLSIYGPLSAFSISKYSQTRILVSIFKKYGAYKNDKLLPLNKFKVNHEDGIKAQEQLDYLVNNSGLSAIQPYITQNLDLVSDSLSKVKNNDYNGLYRNNSYMREYEFKKRKTEWAEKYFGVDKFVEGNSDITYYQFKTKNSQLLNVKGYDYMVRIDAYRDSENDTAVFEKDHIKIIHLNDSTRTYIITLNNEKVSFNLAAFADSLIKSRNTFSTYESTASEGSNNKTFDLPQEALNMNRQTAHYNVTFQINDFGFNRDNKKTIIGTVSGYYLIKVK
jgi:hypothetical protein